MNSVSATQVRGFLLARYSEQIRGMGLDPATLPDSFDLLLSGTIDSFGILAMVGALEKEYGVEFDLTDLDAEKITVIGPLCEFVARQATAAMSKTPVESSLPGA